MDPSLCNLCKESAWCEAAPASLCPGQGYRVSAPPNRYHSCPAHPPLPVNAQRLWLIISPSLPRPLEGSHKMSISHPVRKLAQLTGATIVGCVSKLCPKPLQSTPEVWPEDPGGLCREGWVQDSLQDTEGECLISDVTFTPKSRAGARAPNRRVQTHWVHGYNQGVMGREIHLIFFFTNFSLRCRQASGVWQSCDFVTNRNGTSCESGC